MSGEPLFGPMDDVRLESIDAPLPGSNGNANSAVGLRGMGERLGALQRNLQTLAERVNGILQALRQAGVIGDPTGPEAQTEPGQPPAEDQPGN